MEGLQKAYYRVLRDETKRVRQVSVAVTTTIDCYDYMTRCIARFHEKYPGTDVFFCRDTLPNQRAMFYKGKYDVIVLPKILEAAVLKEDYPYKRIAKSQHVAIMSRNHPLAGRESLATEDLRECVFISIDSPDMPLYRNVEKLKSILKCTEEPTIIKTVLSPDAISSMYEMGQGVFIADHYMDVTRMKNICCIPIRDAYANLVCVWNNQSPAAVRFVSFLKD